MFDDARKSVFAALKEWDLARVVSPTVVPDNAVRRNEDGSTFVTYYYTTSELVQWWQPPEKNVPKMARFGPVQRHRQGGHRKRRSVWVKKQSRHKMVSFGPVNFCDNLNELPQVGDMLAGELVKSDKPYSNKELKAFVKQTSLNRKRNSSYLWWTNTGLCLMNFAHLVLNGTKKSEDDVRELLRMKDGYDDLWALARIVLFHNLQCFVDACRPNYKDRPDRMQLHIHPAAFVRETASSFEDAAILQKFTAMLPQTYVPKPVPSMTSESVFTKRKRDQLSMASFNEMTPNYAPASPRYAPSSPTYDPMTPPGATYERAASPGGFPPIHMPDSASMEEYDPDRPAY